MNEKKQSVIAIAAVFIAAAAFILLLTYSGGIGGNYTSGSGYVSNNEDANDSDTASDKDVVLHWILCGNMTSESDSVFREFNQELSEVLPGIQVEFEVVNRNEYKSRWDVLMATGEHFDIAWLGRDILDYSEEVNNGSLMSLNYLLETWGEDLNSCISDDLWNSVTKDGSVYAIPLDGPLYRPNRYLVVNSVLSNRFGTLEEAGEINRENYYTTEECYDSFEPFLQAAKKNNAIGTGISYLTFCDLADKGYEEIYGNDSPFVIKIFDNSLHVYNKYELASWKACFSTMADWYQKGYIREDIQNQLDPESEDGKSKGSVLYIDEYGEKETAPQMKDTEYEAEYIDLEGYRYIEYDGCRNCLVISKSAENPQQAMRLINFLFSEDGKGLCRLLANGIVRQDYIYLGGDRIARMSDNNNNFLYEIPWSTISPMRQNFEVSDGEFDKIDEYNDQAIRSKLKGFSLDTRMIAMEMKRVKMTADKYTDTLCKGTSSDWESLYNELLPAMKAEGSDKVIEEMQRQIDEFLEQNS